jgi:hypothetical protein
MGARSLLTYYLELAKKCGVTIPSKEGGLDVLMTYDKQLAAGAREHGIAVLPTS